MTGVFAALARRGARPVLIPVLIPVLATILGGCATPVPATGTGWLDGGTLLMRSIDRERSRFERIRIAADDRLEWNGGFEALRDTAPQYEARLDEADLERVRAALRAIGWLGEGEPVLDPRPDEPPAGEQAATMRFVLRVPRPLGPSHEIDTGASDPRFAPLAEVLRELARRRLEPILRELPQADQPAGE